MKQAGSEAGGIAKDIAADVGELSSAARTMAGVIGHNACRRPPRPQGHDRHPARQSGAEPLRLRKLVCRSSNAFDGKQEEMKGKEDFGGNKTGQFSPYWSKNKTGDIQFSTFNVDYSKEGMLWRPRA